MANEEQIRILKQGAVAWNKWRGKHTSPWPALRGANLNAANLRGAGLRGNLTAANFSGAIS